MNELKEIAFFPSAEHVKILGRTVALEDCLLLALSGSGVEFTYKGTKLTVTFYGDSSVKDRDDGTVPWKDQARMAVFVDGNLQLDTVIKKEKESFVVFGEDENAICGEHTVRIIKLSEPRMSSVGLGEIRVLAQEPPRPTSASDRYIEFIGDSITCGYGIDTASEANTFSTTTENVSKAFSYLTAAALSADASYVSYSGHGLISGYTGNPDIPTLDELIQPYYEIFAYSYNTFRGKRLETIKWDFESERKPDTIVINLGTNDASYIMQDDNKLAAFREDYEDFLEQVHLANPRSRIIIAFGLMGDELFETEKEAAESFAEKTGFSDIHTFRLTPQDPEKNGYAADYHPSAASHMIAAKELTEYIRSLGGAYNAL